MQAEFVRVPFAHVNLVKLPNDITDEQAILLSDIFPTGYMAAEMAEIQPGDTVAVFGCGPVGQFAIASAKLLDAGRIIAVDRHASRLEMARDQGAEIINFDEDDPVKTIQRLTDKIGVDRAIDAVGVDAEGPDTEHEQLWEPGKKPSQVLEWAVDVLAKAGTLSIIGVYDEKTKFAIGKAMEKNLTIQMGNCHHRKYIPKLIPIVQEEIVDPATILTQTVPMESVIEAYENFDLRKDGWVKVMIEPARAAKRARVAASEVRARSKK
jgi:threonine dehydrogenase-like Zn-dependent dehydrogenase